MRSVSSNERESSLERERKETDLFWNNPPTGKDETHLSKLVEVMDALNCRSKR